MDTTLVKGVDQRSMAVVGIRFGMQDGMGRDVVVTESGNPPVEIRLSADLGQIMVRMTGDDDKPAFGGFAWFAEGDSIVSVDQIARTDENGVAIIKGLAPGRYRVFAANGSRAEATVEIQAGETALVELRPKKDGTAR